MDDLTTLKKQPVEALRRSLSEARAHLQELRFKIFSNQLKDVRAIRETRRLIARLLTLISEKSSKQS
jgi:ribosomal protein L29